MGNPFLSPFITSFIAGKGPLFWRVVIVDDLDGGGAEMCRRWRKTTSRYVVKYSNYIKSSLDL